MGLGSDEEQLSRIRFYFPDVFALVIADETRKVKSQATVMHRSVSGLTVTYHILLMEIDSMPGKGTDAVGAATPPM